MAKRKKHGGINPEYAAAICSANYNPLTNLMILSQSVKDEMTISIDQRQYLAEFLESKCCLSRVQLSKRLVIPLNEIDMWFSYTHFSFFRSWFEANVKAFFKHKAINVKGNLLKTALNQKNRNQLRAIELYLKSEGEIKDETKIEVDIDIDNAIFNGDIIVHDEDTDEQFETGKKLDDLPEDLGG